MTRPSPPVQRKRTVWIPAAVAAVLLAAHLGLAIRRDGLLMELRDRTREWSLDGYPAEAQPAVEWTLDRTYELLRIDGVSFLLCAGWAGTGMLAAQRAVHRRRASREQAF